MSTLLLFVDGVGLGAREPAINPLAAARLELLDRFDGPEELARPVPLGGFCTPLDAAMGVQGVPQSATGQTALLTGQNAALANGRHLMGFPNGLLREVLREHSVLKRLRARGRRVLFANAFQPIFFLLPPEAQRRRMSATTTATLAAGIPLRTVPDIPPGEAVYHDFTNSGLDLLGYDVPQRTPEEAGRVLAGLVSRHDFVLYEHFLTDKAGHAQDLARGIAVAERLDRFLKAVLEAVDLARVTVLVASDHGNLEDLSQPGHTRNPALGLVWGHEAAWAASHLRTLMDVTETILALDSRAGLDAGGLTAC